MPELPELVVYVDRLEHHLKGRALLGFAVRDPFALRSVSPPLDDLVGLRVQEACRAGKEIALQLDGGITLSFHLMRTGRLHLHPTGRFKAHPKRTRFAADFEGGATLELTEAGTRHRASVRAWASLEDFVHAAGGFDPLDAEFTALELARRIRAAPRELKSALRDRSVLAGIGNAYADEILFTAQLAPTRRTRSLSDEEIERLAKAIGTTLRDWIERVRVACPNGLPTDQSVWRKSMAVHGQSGNPCSRCGAIIARISFKDSETNYCPTCQNEGRILADRRLSRFGIRRPPAAR